MGFWKSLLTALFDAVAKAFGAKRSGTTRRRRTGTSTKAAPKKRPTSTRARSTKTSGTSKRTT